MARDRTLISCPDGIVSKLVNNSPTQLRPYAAAPASGRVASLDVRRLVYCRLMKDAVYISARSQIGVETAERFHAGR